MIATTAEVAGKRTVGKISPKIRTAVTEIRIAITGLGTSLSRKIGRASLAPAETQISTDSHNSSSTEHSTV